MSTSLSTSDVAVLLSGMKPRFCILLTDFPTNFPQETAVLPTESESMCSGS